MGLLSMKGKEPDLKPDFLSYAMYKEKLLDWYWWNYLTRTLKITLKIEQLSVYNIWMNSSTHV